MARPRWLAAADGAVVADAAVEVGAVVEVDTAAAAFRAAAGAAMAAVEAFHEEAMAEKPVTLAAVGVRQ